MIKDRKDIKQNQLLKIHKIFRTTFFRPLKLLKGDLDFAVSFGIKRHNYQKDFDNKTVLYDGLFENKKSIIKIYLYPEKEFNHFERELYIYTQVKKSAPIWKKISAKLFNYSDRPLPFLILEKVTGYPLGDWFHIKYDKTTKPLKELLTILPLVYQQTKLPKKYAYTTYDKLSFFLNRTEKINRTLTILNQTDADYFWHSYLNLGHRLKTKWGLVPNSFIFSDLNPANILILKKGGIRIIDFDAVSLGKKVYDYAFLYYSSIGSKSQKYLFKEIKSHFFQTREKEFFIFFFIYFSLTHSWSFVANKDWIKFKAIMKELKKLLIL